MLNSVISCSDKTLADAGSGLPCRPMNCLMACHTDCAFPVCAANASAMARPAAIPTARNRKTEAVFGEINGSLSGRLAACCSRGSEPVFTKGSIGRKYRIRKITSGDFQVMKAACGRIQLIRPRIRRSLVAICNCRTPRNQRNIWRIVSHTNGTDSTTNTAVSPHATRL